MIRGTWLKKREYVLPSSKEKCDKNILIEARIAANSGLAIGKVYNEKQDDFSYFYSSPELCL